MENILFFSGKKIKFFIQNVRFYLRKAWRWLSLLLKIRKKLQLEYFYYYRYWHFNNAYLIIDFQFKNAIWYKIDNFKSLYSGQPIILNLHNFDSEEIAITVYGFFKKEILKVCIYKTQQLQRGVFHTDIRNLSFEPIKIKDIKIERPILVLNNKLQLIVPKVTNFQLSPLSFKKNIVNIKTSDLNINIKQYKTADYI